MSTAGLLAMTLAETEAHLIAAVQKDTPPANNQGKSQKTMEVLLQRHDDYLIIMGF